MLASSSPSSGPVVVAVSGAAGFIGARLVAALAADGVPVVGLDAFNDHLYDPQLKRDAAARLAERFDVRIHEIDIRETEATAAVLRDADVGAFVHLAALAGVRTSVERPAAYHEANVAGTASVLQALDRAAVPTLVFASSSSIYGGNPDVPWREAADPDPKSPYAETKLIGEGLVADWTAAGGRRGVITRLFTAYGPGQRPDQAITRFAVRMLRGQPIEIYGDGSARRDLTHVDDVVAGLRAAIGHRGGPLTVCNLARGQRIGLLDVIGTIERILGVDADLRFVDPAAGDVPQTWGSIERAELELGWRPVVDLAAGVASARPWFEYLAACGRDRCP